MVLLSHVAGTFERDDWFPDRQEMRVANGRSLDRFWDSLAASGKISAADRDALVALPFSSRVLDAGDPVERAANETRHCTILMSGFAYCSKLLRDGSRQILALHVPGDFLGLANIFQPFNDRETRMMTPGEVAGITASAFRELLAARPSIQQALWRQTALEAAIFSEWLAGVGRRDSQGRIAHLLCEFAVRLRDVGLAGKESFDLPMTQTQLADATGLTSVHVNRVIHGLKQSGLIALEKRTITIKDWEGLSELADFDPAYLQSEPMTAPFSA